MELLNIIAAVVLAGLILTFAVLASTFLLGVGINVIDHIKARK